ncbi:MAG: vanadium nitrogenase [Lachnospiraceae bacterium]|nr:vanadium nitrogenase [Lachnospiraceae bacterium]
MAFAAGFIYYVGMLIIMLIAAALGIFAGKKLRARKNAQIVSENADTQIKE